jgi:hypothetical protein
VDHESVATESRTQSALISVTSAVVELKREDRKVTAFGLEGNGLK